MHICDHDVLDALQLDGPTRVTLPSKAGGGKSCEFGVIDTFAYPLEDGSGHVLVSTTRLETMVGDVAVAVHPEDPQFTSLIGSYSFVAFLFCTDTDQLCSKLKDGVCGFLCAGKRLMHPVSGRLIPVIADAQLVDPTLGTGAVKVTPAHDANDYECGLRHGLEQARSSALLLHAACLNDRLLNCCAPFVSVKCIH